MSFPSFVFKLKHALPSGKEEHRRYGFSGDLRHPAVFTGLHDRVSSVFNLDKDRFHLATSDHLGRRVPLQDHDSFLKLVCEPTLSEEGQKSIKLDDKKRIVLVFHVIENKQEQPAEEKEQIAEAEVDESQSETAQAAAAGDKQTAEALAKSTATEDVEDVEQVAEARQIALAAASDSTPLVEVAASRGPDPVLTTTETAPTAPPAVPLSSLRPCHAGHPQHHHHHAAVPGTSGPGALGGPFHHHHLPPHAHAHVLGHSHAHSHGGHRTHGQEALTADRLSVMAKRIEMRRSVQERLQREGRDAASASQKQPQVVAPSSSGYNPAYSTASSSSVGVESEKVQPQEEERAKTPTPDSPVAETWSGVKGLLKTFVRDLNRHLADNFGDEAANFELSIPAEEQQQPQKTTRKEEKSVDSFAEDERILHSSVFCDNCLKTIIGVRHKCTGCSNYDLCSLCLPTRNNFHNRQHVFARIARPGAMPVVDSPPANTQQPREEPAVTIAAAPQPAAPRAVAPDQPVLEVHPATCDACGRTIQGVRHKCLECPDYDLCSECLTNVGSVVHPLHNFLPIASPSLVRIRAQPGANAIHNHIICDACGASPIIGVRYRCVETECGDMFDMCERCEADPVPRHPRSHVLLKIREPVVSGGEAVTQARMERARQIGGGPFAPSGGDAIPLSGLGGGIERIIKSLVGVGGPSTAEKGTSTNEEQQQQGLPSWATLVNGPGGDRTVVIDVDMNSARTTAGQAPYDVDHLVMEAEKEGEIEEEEPEDEDEGTIAEPEEEQIAVPALKSEFVADVTLNDGSLVPSGGLFSKIWLVRNNGSATWPEGTMLVNVGGFSNLVAGDAGVQQFDVAQAEPGEAVEIQCELKAAEEDGHYMDFWRLMTPSGQLFGDRFWVDIVVESADLANSGSSLNSSFVAPSMHASGKLQGPATTDSAPSAAMSSVTAPSVRSDAIGEFEDVRAEREEESGSEEEISSEEGASEAEEEDEEFVVLTGSEDGDATSDESSEDEEWRA